MWKECFLFRISDIRFRIWLQANIFNLSKHDVPISMVYNFKPCHCERGTSKATSSPVHYRLSAERLLHCPRNDMWIKYSLLSPPRLPCASISAYVPHSAISLS